MSVTKSSACSLFSFLSKKEVDVNKINIEDDTSSSFFRGFVFAVLLSVLISCITAIIIFTIIYMFSMLFNIAFNPLSMMLTAFKWTIFIYIISGILLTIYVLFINPDI